MRISGEASQAKGPAGLDQLLDRLEPIRDMFEVESAAFTD
jgi:hypothetical protein